METNKKILTFGGIGLAISLVIAGLASIAPTVFGWLTIPFWVLPAIANLGAHDVGWPLFALSGIIGYGSAAFLVSLLWRRHGAR